MAPPHRRAEEFLIKDIKHEHLTSLIRALNAGDNWKILATYPKLNMAREDLILLEQSLQYNREPGPAADVIHLMIERMMTVYELYHYLQKKNLPYVMDIVKDYVPVNMRQPLEVSEDFMQEEPDPQPPPIKLLEGRDIDLDESNEIRVEFDSLQQLPSYASMLSTDLPTLTSSEKGVANTIISTKIFAYDDIEAGTNGFHPDFLIHEGTYGNVYRVLLFHTSFAAKVFKRTQNYKAVKADLQEIRNFSHPNIVPITGTCFDRNEVIILYEFMSTSLKQHLDKRGTLSVPDRVNILKDASRGLQYLHQNKKPLIHGNVKSSNILLDDKMRAKISDFGQSRLASANDRQGGNGLTHYSTKQDCSVIQRNKGYCADEVIAGTPSVKSDVYAFGVVMLETCTGKPAYDSTRSKALVDSIEHELETNGRQALDLQDTSVTWSHENTYVALFDLACKSVSQKKSHRPSMDVVFLELCTIEGALTAPSGICESDQENIDDDDEEDYLEVKVPPGEGMGQGLPYFQQTPPPQYVEKAPPLVVHMSQPSESYEQHLMGSVNSPPYRNHSSYPPMQPIYDNLQQATPQSVSQLGSHRNTRPSQYHMSQSDQDHVSQPDQNQLHEPSYVNMAEIPNASATENLYVNSTDVLSMSHGTSETSSLLYPTKSFSSTSVTDSSNEYQTAHVSGQPVKSARRPAAQQQLYENVHAMSGRQGEEDSDDDDDSELSEEVEVDPNANLFELLHLDENVTEESLYDDNQFVKDLAAATSFKIEHTYVNAQDIRAMQSQSSSTAASGEDNARDPKKEPLYKNVTSNDFYTTTQRNTGEKSSSAAVSVGGQVSDLTNVESVGELSGKADDEDMYQNVTSSDLYSNVTPDLSQQTVKN